MTEAVGTVFPSAQLLVVDGFRTVLARAYGACTLQTLFDVASLTKALSTTTLAMLATERGLDLDEEVRPGVTFRLLLCHASGLPAWRLLGATRAEILDQVRSTPLERPAGSSSVYSDLGFILLGDALARRQPRGAGLTEDFASQVARPLGIAATFHPDPARCAPTEGDLRGVVHDENARAMGGAGAGHAGLFSTATDVSAIAASLVASFLDAADAPRIVASSTVRAFWTPCEVPGSTWCLGWDRPSPVGSSAGTRWPHTGVGHLGYTGCSRWIDPARARWVVLLTNRVHPTRSNERIKDFRPRLHDAVVAALDVAP